MARDERGQIVLHVEVPVDDHLEKMIVVFPDFYPEFRFEVFAPDLALTRHQNPFGKNLCLLEGRTDVWSVDDSVASFLTERVPLLLRLLQDESAMRAAEVPQGEPATTYYPYLQPGIVLVPSFALSLPSGHEDGSLEIRVQRNSPSRPLRGLLALVDGHEGRPLGRAEEALLRNFEEAAIPGRWFRLPHPPRTDKPEDIFASLRILPQWQTLNGRLVDIIGLVFLEEVQQGHSEDAWLFVIREKGGGAYFCRGERVSMSDFQARISELRFLKDCRVGVIGLGGLGAPSAIELAKCQVGELRMLDGDLMEAGTAVRWVGGLPAAGLRKVGFVASYIQANYPYTNVDPYYGSIGRARIRSSAEGPENEPLSLFLDGLDLAYDATAEPGVQYFLSMLCAEWGVPHLYVGAMEGGWGGTVVRCLPGTTGCWLCWKLHIQDGNLPLPFGEPNPGVQPRGCASITFTGASFDLLPIVAQGVRLAVQTLSERQTATAGRIYPPAEHDISTLWLRDQDGAVLATPRWEHHKLAVHPDCPLCNKP